MLSTLLKEIFNCSQDRSLRTLQSGNVTVVSNPRRNPIKSLTPTLSKYPKKWCTYVSPWLEVKSSWVNEKCVWCCGTRSYNPNTQSISFHTIANYPYAWMNYTLHTRHKFYCQSRFRLVTGLSLRPAKKWNEWGGSSEQTRIGYSQQKA